MAVWAKLKEADERFNHGINSRAPEDLARRWWWYLVSAGLFIVVATAAGLTGLAPVSLAVLPPTIGMGFMGGFYYCERLRSQGKTRGRYGPSRVPD